jgi:hypothetical protein
MKDTERGMEITLQVGSEFRIKKTGEISIDNPELELTHSPAAADAVISYRFDAQSGDHVVRLLRPVAEKHSMKAHS